jgi:pimeloyl-ACP methyl ester carboxylesterase
MKRYRGQGHGEGEDYLARLASFRSIREVKLAAAGHNMHHDQPEKLAELLEEFFTE